MKIGTLSLNINTDDLNFGAVLHTWAFQQVLLKCKDIEPEVISYIPIYLNNYDRNHPVVSCLKMHRWSNAVKMAVCYLPYKRRLQKFNQFQNHSMIVSDKVYNHESLDNENLKYDCLICESDVIWSAKALHGNFDSTFFLALDSMKNKKKIIYAASMANGEYTQNQKEDFKKLILYPDFISCRESYAVEYVHNHTNRSAAHVIDPVLLLKDKDYDVICFKRLIDEPYLLLYIPLGFDKRYQKAAKQYAKDHGLKIVEISYFVWYKFSHDVRADAGIEEFLSLIKYADMVFTNSFHAVCFALLFHVEFYAFKRKTGRKTLDICDRLSILDHHMDVDEFKEVKKLDYVTIDEKIDTIRAESMNWLMSVLTSGVCE